MNKIFIKLKKHKDKLLNKIFAKKRVNKLKNKNFTIISNNCWAGYVYRFFGMEYLTPTIGLYFFSDDYIKFISNLKYYLSLEIQFLHIEESKHYNVYFLHIEESKHYNVLRKKKQSNVPIGRLDDIEIVFLHYKTEEEAREKWEKRKKRVNYSNLFIKYSLMNDWNEEDIIKFEKLPYENKFFFCHQKKFLKYKDSIYYKGFEEENSLLNDTDYFDRYINIYDFLNQSKKVLILREPKDSYFLKYLNYSDLYNFYDSKRKKTFLFKLIYKANIHMFSYFYDKWKRNMNDYKYVILFDNGYRKDITKFIKKKNKNIKIYFFFWNPITEDKEKILKDRNIDEFYSYNILDCKKYNLKYNTQFYTKNIFLKEQEKKDDILFLGSDKGRKKIIDTLKAKFEKKNLNCNFLIINKEKDFVSYSKYLSMISSCRALLDIVNKNTSGLTLRVLESIFFSKKLISNNKDLINYDFYDSSRIFILDYDNLDELDIFLKKDYKKVEEEILDNYDFESWLKRFFKR